MKPVLQYAMELPALVRIELEQLLSVFASWGSPVTYAPVLSASAGSLTVTTAVASFARVGRTVVYWVELDFTPATGGVHPASVFVALPIPASAARNTASVCSLWVVGVGPDATFGKVLVSASSSVVQLLRGDGTNWTSGSRYSAWLQITYLV